MGEPEERPVGQEYARELTELGTNKAQGRTPAEAAEQQIEALARDMQPLLEAQRDWATLQGLHDFVVGQQMVTVFEAPTYEPVRQEVEKRRSTAAQRVEELKAASKEQLEWLTMLLSVSAVLAQEGAHGST